MSSPVIERKFIQDASPVRLWHWFENPHGLVSLLYMLQVSADRFLEFGRLFQDWNVRSQQYGPLPLDEDRSERFKETLVALKLHCDSLELPVTTQLFRDSLNRIKTSGTRVTNNMASDLIGELYRCFISELKSQVFFFIEPRKAAYYSDLLATPAAPLEPAKQPPRLFGKDVSDKFASAEYDIREAGDCYALGRNTACVFHLMRVLEIGLSALGKVFNVSLERTNWAPAIKQIESKINDMHKDPAWKSQADYKQQQEFYSQVASHFEVLKNAWRNYTAHARGKYEDTEAEPILLNCRGFMQKLATRLHD